MKKKFILPSIFVTIIFIVILCFFNIILKNTRPNEGDFLFSNMPKIYTIIDSDLNHDSNFSLLGEYYEYTDEIVIDDSSITLKLQILTDKKIYSYTLLTNTTKFSDKNNSWTIIDKTLDKDIEYDEDILNTINTEWDLIVSRFPYNDIEALNKDLIKNNSIGYNGSIFYLGYITINNKDYLMQLTRNPRYESVPWSISIFY